MHADVCSVISYLQRPMILFVYLDITVYVTMLMEILHSLQSLFKNGSYYSFVKAIRESGLHNVKARAATHVWHHHPKCLVMNKRTMCFQNIWVVDQCHGLCLAHYVVLLPQQRQKRKRTMKLRAFSMEFIQLR
jgi:hypothetical protein